MEKILSFFLLTGRGHLSNKGMSNGRYGIRASSSSFIQDRNEGERSGNERVVQVRTRLASKGFAAKRFPDSITESRIRLRNQKSYGKEHITIGYLKAMPRNPLEFLFVMSQPSLILAHSRESYALYLDDMDSGDFKKVSCPSSE